METTEGRLELRYGEYLPGDLVSGELLTEMVIAEVRPIKDCNYFGKCSEKGALADPFVLVFTDGSISRPFVLLEVLNFVEAPAESLIASGLLSREYYEKRQLQEREEQEQKQRIETLKKQRAELQGRLAARNRPGVYRGIVRQLQGVEDELEAMGHKFPKA